MQKITKDRASWHRDRKMAIASHWQPNANSKLCRNILLIFASRSFNWDREL